jgi:hypothetical protein
MKMVYVVDLTSKEGTGLLELVGTGEFVMLSGVHRGRVHTELRGARERSGSKREGATVDVRLGVEDARVKLERLYPTKSY